MRSRYSAYATDAVGYIRDTWAAETRPDASELSAENREWLRLRIVDVGVHTVVGAGNTDQGVVEFVAVSSVAGIRERLHERSRFVRRAGRWFYVDGVIVS